MIKVVFFAHVRELVGVDSIDIPNGEYSTADDLRVALSQRSDKWALAMNSDKLLVAINQVLSPLDSKLPNDAEVAFFPPVTGG